MRFDIIQLISRLTFNSLIKQSQTKWLLGLFNLLLILGIGSSYIHSLSHHHTADHYSHDVRERWENNPDKHPHRMAHYGYVVFREQYPLSFFDVGMDSYLGNAVFLEAHRQNTINFSQVSMSNGLLRFGELSAGLVLQLLVPLLIFFWGFWLVAGERESGIIKLLLAQGTKWSEIIIGKSLGLFLVSLLLLIPAILIAFVLLIFHPSTFSNAGAILGFGALAWSYIVYLGIISLLAVLISAKSRTKKSALIQLIGIWLFFTLIFPKISQVSGQLLYPTPSKIEFDTAVEQDIIKQGDSHNPDDPHFKAIKDSLLAAHNVLTTNELPFNYSGFIMKNSEKLSTETYRRHQEGLMEIYKKQGQVVNLTAFLNPYIAMKNISMVMSGTDLSAYQNFDRQAEAYRYDLAQTMNELQMEHISNNIASSADKKAEISQQYWIDFPDFQYQFLSFGDMFRNVFPSFLALSLWIVGLLIVVFKYSKKLKAI